VKDGVSTPRASGPTASARVVSSVTSRIDGRSALSVRPTATSSEEPPQAAHAASATAANREP